MKALCCYDYENMITMCDFNISYIINITIIKNACKSRNSNNVTGIILKLVWEISPDKNLWVIYKTASNKLHHIIDRSSRPDVFWKSGALRNFAKFTGKHLCQGLFFNKFAGWHLQLYEKRDPGTSDFLGILRNL